MEANMTFNSPVANLAGSPRKADLRSDSQLLYSDTSLFQRSLVISEALNLTPLRLGTGAGQSESGSPSLSYDSVRETIEAGIEAFGVEAPAGASITGCSDIVKVGRFIRFVAVSLEMASTL